MTEEKAKHYYELKGQIIDRLNSEVIVPNNEIVSVQNVFKAIEAMIPYNKVLLEEINEEREAINKKNGFYKANYFKAFKKHLFIRNIEVALDGNGICNIFVYYWDENRNNGIVRYSADLYQELGKEYKVNIAMSEENEAKISHINFAKYFREAKKFADEFPDVPYIWSKTSDNVYDQLIGDEFLDSQIRLNDAGRHFIGLRNPRQHELSRERINEGYLFDDYIEMSNKSLSTRTPVNMNDLNPFLQLITKKYLGLEEDFTLKRQ